MSSCKGFECLGIPRHRGPSKATCRVLQDVCNLWWIIILMLKLFVDWLMPLQAHGKTGGEAQEWVRAMLGTVGRGGNAQVSVCCLSALCMLCPCPWPWGKCLSRGCMHILLPQLCGIPEMALSCSFFWQYVCMAPFQLDRQVRRNGTLLHILLAVTTFKAV